MTAGSKPYAVLFVCTGNICRSPTAHAVFRARAREAGLAHAFHIDSAGTHDYHSGEPPDPRAVHAALREAGIDMADLRARRVRAEDFEAFDLILAMDGGHLAALRRIAPPGCRARLRLFAAENVPDPYYGGAEDFRHVLRLSEAGAAALLAELRAALGI